jgi:hypothetical protein
MKYSYVILSGVLLDVGEKNGAKDLYDIEKILRFAGLSSASSGCAQNDILIYNIFALGGRLLYLRCMF